MFFRHFSFADLYLFMVPYTSKKLYHCFISQLSSFSPDHGVLLFLRASKTGISGSEKSSFWPFPFVVYLGQKIGKITRAKPLTLLGLADTSLVNDILHAYYAISIIR